MKSAQVFRSLCLALGTLCLAGLAQAQTAWDTNTITWDAPTTCTTGQPITNCPVTQYQIQRAASSSGSYAQVGTSTTTTYVHQSAAAGVNCYRVVVVAAQGSSVPSTHVCKNNVQPSGPPNPATNVRLVTEVVSGVNYAPAFTVLTDGARSTTVAGFVAVGTPCEGPVLFRYRNKDWMKPSAWKAWSTPTTARVAAPCA
jgi:hypothetical protein